MAAQDSVDPSVEVHWLTRRALLQTGGAAALALSLPAAAAASGRRAFTSSYLRRSSYTGLVGQSFNVKGAAVKLRLVSIEDLNSRQAQSEDAFALIFRGPAGSRAITDQVPRLRHPALGSFELLISPGAPSGDGQPYCAVINRLSA